MAEKQLAYEGNTDLAFDTAVFMECGRRYGQAAGKLRRLASGLDDCLTELAESGWTTGAGKEFQEMTRVNWKENIEKYAKLLETLEDIMIDAAGRYEELAEEYIEKHMERVSC